MPKDAPPNSKACPTRPNSKACPTRALPPGSPDARGTRHTASRLEGPCRRQAAPCFGGKWKIEIGTRTVERPHRCMRQTRKDGPPAKLLQTNHEKRTSRESSAAPGERIIRNLLLRYSIIARPRGRPTAQPCTTPNYRTDSRSSPPVFASRRYFHAASVEADEGAL